MKIDPPRRSTLVRSLLLAGLAPMLACGAGPEDAEDPTETTSAIIGGSAISGPTRRLLGLVDANGCSGSIIAPDWVMTASHCIDFQSPSANQFSIPRPNGTLETRVGQVVSRVGLSDTTIVNLAPTVVVSDWPSLTRTMLRTPTPGGLVGQNVACYGRGDSAYANPSGLTGFGTWKSLIKKVSGQGSGRLYIDSVNGDQIPAPGDSGGVCTFGSQAAGTIWQATNVNCADATSTTTCNNTITKINTVAIQSTAVFADYIDSAASRTATTFKPLTLQTGWTNNAFAGNFAGYAVFDGTVHLRGAVFAPGNANLAVAFILPAGATPPVNVYVPVTLCDAAKGRLLIETNGKVNVVVEGGDWTKAQCLVSLEGVSFPRSSFGVPALTLKNGWTTTVYGTRAPAARLSAGVVRLEGAMSGGTDPYAFNLPAAFRPAQDVYLPIDLCGGRKGRLYIQSTGDAYIYSEVNFSDAQCFTSLEGVTYVLAQQSAITLVNGWSTYGGTRTPAATNVGGIIRLQGAAGTAGTNSQIFQLPAAMRPATAVFMPVDLCNGVKGRLLVTTDGRAYVSSVGGNLSPAPCFTSLEGAWFGI
jgi:hypothetical protein